MKNKNDFPAVWIALFITLAFSSGAVAQSQDDDMLLYIPALIAPKPKDVCNQNELRRVRGNGRARIVCDLDLGGNTITLARGAKLFAVNGSLRNRTLIFDGG